MPITRRVATCAAITATVLTFVGASNPGFASEIPQTSNASLAYEVPAETATLQDAIATVIQAPVSVEQPQTAPDATPEAPATSYATLAEAVAAHDDQVSADENTTCLASAIYFEAKGEPLSGQLAVAEVILNRSKSGRFPGSVCSVVTQPGQFAFVRGGHVPQIGGNRAFRTAVAVARVAMANAWDSPASNAMYFHARRVSPRWHRVEIAAIGNHVFYK